MSNVNLKFPIIMIVCILMCTPVMALQTVNASSNTAPKAFKKFDLSFSSPPELNKPVELILEVLPISMRHRLRHSVA